MSNSKTIDPKLFEFSPVKDAYEYWLSKSACGRVPRRSDVDPKELRGLLPFVFLIDVEREPLRFKYRLMGTQLTQWAGREYTGFAFNDQEGPNWKEVFEDFRSVVDTRKPRYDVRQAPWVSKQFYRYERILAPLSDDGVSVDILFGAAHVF